MMYKKILKRFTGVFLSLIFLGVMVSTASAVVYDLCTGPVTNLTMPDGITVNAWGFGFEDGGDCATASVPGPLLEVPVGDDVLTINLHNTLPDPVSLNILGQVLSPNTGPVWSELDGTVVANPRAAGNFTARVRSFAHEADAGGGTATYTWPNFKPGTFALTSGTNPAKQVQMGLYAAVKKDAAAGMAYTDNPETAGDESVAYDKELIMLYSEVDPLMQSAIATGNYGPGGTITSSLQRDPKYFLINGMAFDPTSADGGGLDPINSATALNAGDIVLVRFLNAGYETHVPQLLNMYMTLVAEDGNPYAYPREQYGVQLPAGKTIDAVFTMPTTIGRFSIHDAAHHLTNNGTGAMGGMLAFISAPSCVGAGDIHPTGALDKDVDGLDLYQLTLNLAQVDLAVFAENFGRVNCP